MAQPLRVFEPNVSVHVIHRGNNHCTIFGDDGDYELFLLFLKRAVGRCGVAVHAFTLMTTHYHMIATPNDALALPRAMKIANGRYVRHFNRKYDRVGTLVNGRYRAIPIENELYWLTCLRYVELNPVRARMVHDPATYPWSSYRLHAHGDPLDWISRHPLYDALGRDNAERQAVYRGMCMTPLRDAQVLVQKVHAESAI